MALEWTQRVDRECLLLVSRLSPVSVLSVVGNFMRRLRLSSTITRLRKVVGGSLHCLFQQDVRLSSVEGLAHLGDVLQEGLVKG